MKKLMMAVIAACAAVGAWAATTPDDFKYMVEFTAPAVTVGSNPSEFENIPVLVWLQNDDAKFAYSKLSFPETGKDIAFFDLSGNQLPHEIDNWNPNGVSTVWVKLPKLETGAKFRMCFGCDDEDKVVTPAASGVWTGYQAVWHMNGMNAGAAAEDPTTTPDSTANKMDAVVRDTKVSTVAEAGAVGHALVSDVNSTAKKAGFVVPNSAALMDTGNFALSCWLRRATADSWYNEVPFSTKVSKGASTGGFCLARVNNDSEIGFYTTGSTQTKTSSCNLNGTEWLHFVISYVDGKASFYRNGADGGSCTVAAATYAASENDLGIGTFPGDGNVRSWWGEIDEVRWIRGAGLSAQRVAADYAMMAKPDYFDIQGVPHGDAHIVTVTKSIPALGYDIPLPDCHQTYMTDTNTVLTCSEAPRNLYFTKDDIAYQCVGYVFTPVSGDPIEGGTPNFAYQPATMGDGALDWKFAEVGYRARVHALPPFLADKAEIAVTPDSEANHLFGCFYKSGTVLTVTLTELEEGVFDGWRGAAGWMLDDPSAKTCSYTVEPVGSNPDLVASVCGVAYTDDDRRLSTENFARMPLTRYVYLATTGNDANDGLTSATAVKTLAKALSIARAGYAADGAQQVILVGAGKYTTSSCTIAEPIIFEGGLDNPTLIISKTYIQFTCWYNLTNDRAAMRRLTLAGVDGWDAKDAGLISVAAGTLEGVTITNAMSGANYNAGAGAIRLSGTGVITNSLITHCRAPVPGTAKTTSGVVNMKGGALVSTRITHCSSEGTGTGVGGGVYMTGGTIRNCLIDNCKAYTQGSGLYVEAAANCTVENCTIVDCSTVAGASVAIYGAWLKGAGAAKKVRFVNNVVYGNSGVLDTQKDTMNIFRSGTLSYLELYNNLSDVALADDATTGGNVAGNPAFKDRANEDYTTGKGAGVDKGLDLAWAHADWQTDLAGNNRILGVGLDIGCYEYVPSTVLDLTVDVLVPDPLEIGSTITLVADAVGGAGDYTYTWFVNGAQVASGKGDEYAAYGYVIPNAGAYAVSCTVRDAAGAEVSKDAASEVKVYIRRAFVAKTGSNTAPYDTMEKAATEIETVTALLDPQAEVEVIVGPGVYETAKTLSFGQKTHFHSTEGAEKTVIRPGPDAGGFAAVADGTLIEGFTVEGMSGSVAGLTFGCQMVVSNICFRSCNTRASSFIVSSGDASAPTTYNLSFHSVTNSSVFYGAGATWSLKGPDVHHNLSFVNCKSGGRFVSTSVRGIQIWNGLFLGCQSGGDICWSQNGSSAASKVAFNNVTIDDCVVGGAVFNSNNSGNPYYLYNCIVDDIWTTTAKTARRAVFAARGYANVYSSCFRDDVVSGTPALGAFDEFSLNATDPRLKSRGRLKGSSPCLGKGATSYWTSAWKGLDFTSEIDLVGNLRFHKAGVDEEGHPLYRIDMGCYENDPPGLLLMLK